MPKCEMEGLSCAIAVAAVKESSSMSKAVIPDRIRTVSFMIQRALIVKQVSNR